MTKLLLTVIMLVAGAPLVLLAAEREAKRPRSDRYGDPLPEGAIARLGTLRLRGCQGPVVFSPDGKYVVAAGGDGDTQAVFWDAATGRRIKALATRESIQRLVFSPSGKHLAAVGNRGFFNPVWDVATGKQRFTFTGHTVAFSAADKKLISTYVVWSEETTVRSYDTADGKQQIEWSLAHPRLGDFTLSTDGQFAAAPSAGDKSIISVFDLRKKVEVKKLLFNVERVHGIGFSRDGRRLVAGGVDGWVIWDWASGKSLRLWKGCVHNEPAFSPDGRRLAWIGEAEDRPEVVSLWVVDVDGGQPRRLGVTNSIRWTHPAAFSDDGKKLAVVTEGNALAIVDSRTGRDLLPLDTHTGRVESVAYFSNARYVVTRDSFRLLVWEAATGRLLRRLPDDLPAGETVLLNTTTRGRIVTAELPDGILRLRDLVSGKELRRLKGKGGFVSAAPWDVSAVSSDGTSAAILGPGSVRVYDLDNGVIRCRFTTDHPIWRMDFSADARTLVVMIKDFQKGLITTFRDARTGRQVETPAGGPKLRKNSAGRWQEWGKEAKARLQGLKLLDAQGLPAFAENDSWIASVCESPGGRYLAVEGETSLLVSIDPANKSKSFIRIWDRTTRRLIVEIGDKHGIGMFSSDARTFLSSTYSSGTIHLWEMATGRERLRFVGHMLGYLRLGFRPDGRALVSGGADTQVLLWDVTGRASDGVWRPARHSPERLRQLWKALAGQDAAQSYRAMWALAAAPAQTVALIQEQLPPINPVEPRRLSRLLEDLDSDQFAVRENASQQLEKLGELAEPALRRFLKNRPTLESRRRCDGLLEKLSALSGERLRAVRAIEVLEHIDTAEARALLEKLRQGDPAARLTREARMALDRLAAKP